MNKSSRKHFLAVVGAACLCASAYAVPTTYNGGGNFGANSTTYSFTATGSGDVTAYFAGQTAGYGSNIGMSVNGAPVTLFGLQNHSSAYGDSLILGSILAGDVITFVMQASTSFWGPPPVDYVWSSNPAANSDGLNHIYSSPYAGDLLIPAGTYVGFEDLPGGGDLDYDDHQFVFTGPFQARQSVPDAGSTLAFLGLASAAMVAIRSRRK